MKRIIALLAILLACGLALAGCASASAGSFLVKDVVVEEILGPVPGEFPNYTAALEAAKNLYPRAQGVIYYTGTGGSNVTPWQVEIAGYYAVTFQLADPQKSSGLFKR